MYSKNEVKGKGKQIKGAIKIKVGELTNNPTLEGKGKSNRLEGKIQEKAGKALRKTGEAVQRVGRAISGKR